MSRKIGRLKFSDGLSEVQISHNGKPFKLCVARYRREYPERRREYAAIVIVNGDAIPVTDDFIGFATTVEQLTKMAIEKGVLD